MPNAIRQFCRDSGQAVPEIEGSVMRCALESFALRYRMVLGWLEQLTGSRIATIHIVGGGAQNKTSVPNGRRRVQSSSDRRTCRSYRDRKRNDAGRLQRRCGLDRRGPPSGPPQFRTRRIHALEYRLAGTMRI